YDLFICVVSPITRPSLPFPSSFAYLPLFSFFFFNNTPTTEIYTLSLHDALPISVECARDVDLLEEIARADHRNHYGDTVVVPVVDRKSTRLNSSHVAISYAVFCLKKKKHPIHKRWKRVVSLAVAVN